MVGSEVRERNTTIGPAWRWGIAEHGDRVMGGPRSGCSIERAVIVRVVIGSWNRFGRAGDQKETQRTTDVG